MLMGRVDNVFVNLVGDDVHIIPGRQRRDGFQLLPRKDLAAGVGGVAEHQRFGVLAESVLQHVGVKVKIRRHQRDIDRLRAGENGVRAVVLIERREDNHLVAGIGDGHHGRHHGLRAAAGGNDLAVGVNGPPHIVGLLGGQRFPEVLRAPGDGILVIVLIGYLRQPVENGLGRFKVREPLRQIYRIVLQRDPRHPADDGIGKAGSALR